MNFVAVAKELQKVLGGVLAGQVLESRAIDLIKTLCTKRDLSQAETLAVVRGLFSPFVTPLLMRAKPILAIKIVQLVLWWIEQKPVAIPRNSSTKPLVDIIVGRKQYAVQEM